MVVEVNPIVGIYLLSTLGFYLISSLFSRRGNGREVPLPPGPKGSFIAGVKAQLPASEPWKTYASWGKQYNSPIILFRVYNRSLAVLNTISAIQTLLNQRAEIYSHRPMSWMYNVICGRGQAIFQISPTDATHKTYRKLLQTELGVRGTKIYAGIIQEELGNLVEGMRSNPERWVAHIRRNASAVIMKVAFGYTVKEDDAFIAIADEASRISSRAMQPGRWLVDYCPLLRFVPSFFPGAGWKRQGLQWREKLQHLSEIPHQWVKSQMEKGDYTDSFTSRLLRREDCQPLTAEEENTIKWCAGGLYAGAGDTTVSALISFVLLMSLHPEVERRAQAELDTILGAEHLPTPSDIEHLPYLHAILKEVLRYAPVGNLALPHRVIEDDEYMGYRIPKDTTVIANVWAVMHDPELYPDPFTFSPDRFTASDTSRQPDPRQFAFGFGKRACPGTHFAETTMLVAMAGILSQFAISLPHKDAPPPVVEFTTGITSHIKPFEISIVPRVLR
ncbi:hypothetical protein K443DRAFT_293866 [Laccaria amethystina LaAM-08-1]|uniref:Cytochrome P450 n=1 Tax=Laccaria amethystina LaAM-08-1 TaxID=1095629 RepID=A0A0C9WUY4_9AGAR|nr:hypothetical protein K443DRAFT_293866 [Laccaria amethystina LaAM-08-1]